MFFIEALPMTAVFIIAILLVYSAVIQYGVKIKSLFVWTICFAYWIILSLSYTFYGPKLIMSKYGVFLGLLTISLFIIGIALWIIYIPYSRLNKRKE